MIPMLVGAASAASAAYLVISLGFGHRAVLPTYQVTAFRVVDVSVSMSPTSSMHSSSFWGEDDGAEDKGATSPPQTSSCPPDNDASLPFSWPRLGMPQTPSSWWSSLRESSTSWWSHQIERFGKKLGELEFAARVDAGISVDNRAGFFGADVHAATFDLYYEGRDGNLISVGQARDNDDGRRRTTADGDADQERDGEQGKIHQQPSFTVHPRRITRTVNNAISLHFRRIAPATYFGMLRDLILSPGSRVSIPSSGVAHVKSSVSRIPLTIGIVCENVVAFRWASFVTGNANAAGDSLPVWIEDVECSVERFATSWLNATKVGEEMRTLALERHRATGSVLKTRKKGREEKEPVAEIKLIGAT